MSFTYDRNDVGTWWFQVDACFRLGNNHGHRATCRSESQVKSLS